MCRCAGPTLLALSAIVALAGCYRPHGSLMPSTGEPETFYSYQLEPKTITIVDIRTNDILWQLDIPPGKQLTMDFVEGSGDDPIRTPDLLRWQIFDIGTKTGRLENSITVPSQHVLRIDVDVRQGPEFMTAAPDDQLRTDDVSERPDWWTPNGGPMPDDTNGITNYDR